MKNTPRLAAGYFYRDASILLLAMVCILTGCETKDGQLQKYIDEVQARPAQKLEPIPEVVPYVPYVYSAANLRSPFQPKYLADADLKPEMKHKREPLEAFPLDSLRMVGTFSQAGKMWGLVANQEGSVFRVTAGNYLGQNYGRIINISPQKISIVENFIEDGDWVERPGTLVLTPQNKSMQQASN